MIGPTRLPANVALQRRSARSSEVISVSASRDANAFEQVGRILRRSLAAELMRQLDSIAMRRSFLLAILFLTACDPARKGSITISPRGTLASAARDSVIQRAGRILKRGGVDSTALTRSYCQRQWDAQRAVDPQGIGATAPLSVCLDTNQTHLIVRFWEAMGDSKLTLPSEQLRHVLADSLHDLGTVVLDRAS